MSANFDAIKLLINMDGAWVDVSDDIVGIIHVSAGIMGNSPLDRIASTGTMEFTLKNTGNVYTPTHTACHAGFEKGAVCKLVIGYQIAVTYEAYVPVTKTKFYGRIEAIEIKRGKGLDYYTSVTAVDYMNAFATHELHLPTFAQNKKLEEVVALIVANMDLQPGGTSYGTGQDTFLTVFDTVGERERALSEMAKVTNSELGTVYVTNGGIWSKLLKENGDALLLENGGKIMLESAEEVLNTRGRYDHVTENSAATFTDADLSSAQIVYGSNYYNEVKTVVYPRVVDASATSVLFSLDKYISIAAGETITITGRYTDPDQKAQNVTGIDMVTPVATTDYLFNTAADGGGSDITADLDVTAVYGTNGVEYTLTNNNASTGYVTFLQARGKGVYAYQNVEYSESYSGGISADGRRTLNLEMPYHDNALVASDFASMLLDTYKTKALRVNGIAYDANKSATLLEYFCTLNVGDKITLDLSDFNMQADYFINGVDFEIDSHGQARVGYLVISEALLPAGDYWKLDDASYSQLGETTKLGF